MYTDLGAYSGECSEEILRPRDVGIPRDTRGV
jgi:hypothetical protein